jgi:hypothetical protein
VEQHIKILGWLYIAMGALGVVVGVFVFLVLGIAGAASGEAGAAVAAGGVGLFVAIIIAVVSLPSLIAGWGLMKRKSWSRMLAIVLGALSLLSIPVGTALGIYTIWALTKPESQALLNA